MAIRLDSPGPVLFRPKRIGRDGKHFVMYKFRTMVRDAHERLDEYAHLNLADGMVKIPHDPRVTRVGKWLRRYSLDELPQIYNVLAGHMSLVGPRPHDVHELANFDLARQPRLKMRPGLTGMWQVNARSDPSLASRIHFDTLYVNGWSLVLDAKILAKTIPTVVLGRGGIVESHPNSNGAHVPGPRPNDDPASASSRPQRAAQHGPASTAVHGNVDIAAIAVSEEGC